MLLSHEGLTSFASLLVQRRHPHRSGRSCSGASNYSGGKHQIKQECRLFGLIHSQPSQFGQLSELSASQHADPVVFEGEDGQLPIPVDDVTVDVGDVVVIQVPVV